MTLILPQRGRIRSSFNPVSLIGSGDTGMYYDPTNSANYTLSGSRVSILFDLGPSGTNLVPRSTGPEIVTVNGVPQIEIIGTVTGPMTSNNNSIWANFNREITICCIATPSGAGTSGNTFWAPNITLADLRRKNSQPTVPFSIGIGSRRPWLGWYDGLSTPSDSHTYNGGTTLTGGTTYVFTFIANLTSASVRLDGVADGGNTDTTATGSRVVNPASNRFTLGARTTDSDNQTDDWEGEIGPFFVINRVLTGSELNSIETHFLGMIS